MKKQFLSLIAAGLMLGNMPQICAGPELFLGALAAIVGATHLRSIQMNNSATHVDEKTALTTMFKNNVLPSETVFIPVKTNLNDLFFAIKTERINTEWVWQVFHLPKGLPLPGNTTDNERKILEEPVTTTPHGERYDDYLLRFKKAQIDLIERAKEIVQENSADMTH